MPLLLWVARLVSSALALCFNLAASGALFLLSAYLFTHGDEDAQNVGWFVRGAGAIWLWVAVWSFILHGVVQRERKPHDPDRKPTAPEAALSTVGCLGGIAAVAFLFVYVGQQADWAMAGVRGDDPQHPARQWVETALLALQSVLSDPDPARFFPWFAGVVGGLIGLRVFLATADPRRRKPAATGRAAGQPRSARRQRGGREATASSLPASTAAAATASPRSQTIEDATLGRLRWESGRSMWRVQPPSGVGALYIDTNGAAPSAVQVDLARTIAQRSFEVLLRGSDAARPAAQANGVGLPRFTIAEAVVHADQGRATAATLQLRCDSDASRTYAVRSTDGLNTYHLA